MGPEMQFLSFSVGPAVKVSLSPCSLVLMNGEKLKSNLILPAFQIISHSNFLHSERISSLTKIIKRIIKIYKINRGLLPFLATLSLRYWQARKNFSSILLSTLRCYPLFSIIMVCLLFQQIVYTCNFFFAKSYTYIFLFRWIISFCYMHGARGLQEFPSAGTGWSSRTAISVPCWCAGLHVTSSCVQLMWWCLPCCIPDIEWSCQ